MSEIDQRVKKKPGRRSRVPGMRSSIVVASRLSAPEVAELEAFGRAQGLGSNRSEIVRAAILRGLRAVTPPGDEEK